MKHLSILFLLFFSVLVSHGVNVRDFGAKGDGKHDDTAAFQKAFDAVYQKYPQDSAPKSCREVLVPAGTYRLTRTLVFRNALVLRGEGKAILNFEKKDSELIYGAGRFARISGITFRGGSHQLRFWTNNIDASCFDIIDCRFENASKAAIECNSYADRGVRIKGKKKPVPIKYPPLTFKKNGDFYDLTPVDLSKFSRFYNSTKLTVEDCRFLNCIQAVDCTADGVTVRRCKAVSSPETTALFKLGTRAFVYDIDAVIKKNAKLRQALVEYLGGTCQITDTSVKTDKGSGAYLIRHLRKSPGNYLGDSIILTRIKCETGKALIDSLHGAVPQILMIQDVTATGKQKAKVFSFGVQIDQKTMFLSTPASYQKRFTQEQCFGFSFSGNKNIDEKMPALLVPFVRKLTAKLPPPIPFPKKPEFKGKILHAKSFGIGEKAAPGDEKNLKRLFAAARKSPGCTVILPGRDFLLRAPLQLPPDIHVFAEGTCHLIGKKTDTLLMTVNNPRKVLLSNLAFSKGKQALKVTADAGKKGLVILQKCNGYDLTEAMVEMYSAGKKVVKDPSMQLFIDGGLWITSLIYAGNADAVIDNQWIENKLYNHRIKKRIPDSSTVFINHGKMELIDMLGVPLALRKSPRNGIAPAGTLPGDHRWVDNYGILTARHNRFGGEFGGMVTVYHFGAAQSRVYGGSSWYNTDYAHRTVGISDTASADFIISGLLVSPYNNRREAPELVCQQNEKKELTPVQGIILHNIIPYKKRL